MHSGLFEKVVVATDDNRIKNTVLAFGGEVAMTNPDHQSGTDRCGEVVNSLPDTYDVVINIQGDEPFIHKSQLEDLVQLFKTTPAEIGTLKKELNNIEDVHNKNVVKVVAGIDKRALYFSRNPIPFVRDAEKLDWLNIPQVLQAFRIIWLQSIGIKRVGKIARFGLGEKRELRTIALVGKRISSIYLRNGTRKYWY